MGRKYPQVTDGEWIRPVRRGYRMRCCDCGLVHRMNFRAVKRKGGGVFVELQPFRDERATGAVRRKKFIVIGKHPKVPRKKR